MAQIGFNFWLIFGAGYAAMPLGGILDLVDTGRLILARIEGMDIGWPDESSRRVELTIPINSRFLVSLVCWCLVVGLSFYQ